MPAEPYPQTIRLVQIQGVTLLAVAGVLVQNLVSGQRVGVLLLASACLALAGSMLLARAGRIALATSITLVILTAMGSAFLWLDQGPRDPAILVFPGVLVIAAIQGSRRLFLGLLGWMLVIMGFLVTANVRGWHLNHVRPVTYATFVDLACTLIGIGFVAWILAGDLRRALASLKAENARVLQSQSQIEFLAQHDALTGLPNRSLGRDRLEQAVAYAARNHACTALIQMDLDDFKAINDSLGHLGGDDLLLQVAQRLTHLLRTTDTVCRQGGDEFLIVLGAIHSSDEAAAIAIKVLEGLAVPFQVRGLDVTMTVSMGIALCPADGSDFDTLLQKAEMAMYSAKEAGRNTFRFFLAGMNSSVQEHLHLVSGLRVALAEDRFVLHYQPQYDLASGEIVGAEALIRWRHPELGLVPPATFIPVAERSGLIGEMGAWALRESCRQAMAWRRHGLRLVMSVNLSPVQFRRDDLESTLFQALEETGLPASALELELTESMLIDDSPQIRQRLRNLRNMGLGFSIDDFGTGYSNLGYLKRFEVERLKIDQSFIRRLTEDPQDEAIVRAMIQMAHGLNLGIVAEGIEDQATLARLIELKCDMGQGFYWAKALPAEEFLDFAEHTQHGC